MAAGAEAGKEGGEILSHTVTVRKHRVHDLALEEAVVAAAENARGFSFAVNEKARVDAGTALFRDANGRITDDSFLDGLRRYKASRAHGRLSRERIDATVALASGDVSELDYENLCRFADDGADLVSPLLGRPGSPPRPFFAPPSDPRKRSVFEFGMLGTVERGDAVVVWEKELLGLSPELLNFIAPHWVPKEGKVAGRVIGDASRNPFPLNDQNDRETIRERYGRKVDPTFDSVALLLFSKVCEHGAGNLLAWKSDVSNAFNQIDVAASHVAKQTLSVSGGVAVVQVTMTFGSNTSANAFGACTRVARAAVAGACGTDVDAHTDDLFGCDIKEKVVGTDETPGILVKVVQVIEGFLGPGSANQEKTIYGESLEIIGWEWDLKHGVRAKEKNYRKMRDAFAAVKEGQAMPVRFWMGLSAMVSRYQKVLPHLRWLRPVLTRVHAMREGCQWNSKDALIKADEAALQAIRIAKLVFEEYETPGGRYTLPWSLAVILPALFLVESDASLGGYGVRIWKVAAEPDFDVARWCRQQWKEGSHRNESLEGAIEADVELSHERGETYDFGTVEKRASLVFASAGRWPYDWAKLLQADPARQTKQRKSSVQNTCEFLGHLVGKLILAREGHRDAPVTPIMDSVSAMKWAKTTASKSQFCRWPLLLDTALAMECRLVSRAGVYINTKDMKLCDTLSRAADPRKALSEAGIPPELWKFPTEKELELADPTFAWDVNDDDALMTRWHEMRQYFRV